MSEGYREDFLNAGDLFRYVRSLDPERYKWLAGLIGSGVVAKTSGERRTQFFDYVVPSIYQDSVYMEAVIRHFEPDVTEEQLAQDLAIGTAGKLFFAADPALNYLTENAISQPFNGSYNTISDLAQLAQSGMIIVQIIPDAAVAENRDGLRAIAGGAFTYFGFSRLVYVEGEIATGMTENSANKLLRAAAKHAYSSDQSLGMLGAAAAVHQAEGR